MTSLRDRKREQSRAATMQAAWRLFIERGYDHVTVNDICAAADIAPRTFHRYFASKEDVVAEPVRRMSRVVADAIAVAPPDAGDGDVLRDAMLALGRFVVDSRELLTALRIVAQRSHQLRPAHLGVRPDQEEEIASRLAARRPGAVVDWRVRLLVACTTAAFRVWYDDYFRHAPADPGGHLDTILSTAANGTASLD
jgi:AcrR family transcriptional regulator